MFESRNKTSLLNLQRLLQQRTDFAHDGLKMFGFGVPLVRLDVFVPAVLENISISVLI